MNWFFKPKYGLKIQKNTIKPLKGIWYKCLNCKKIIYQKELEENLWVCSKCNYHYRLKSRDRLESLLDKNSFKEYSINLVSDDPIKFSHANKDYKEHLKYIQKKTNLKDAIIIGRGKIHGLDAQFCIMDFYFFGGSMGIIMGEKIVRAINYSIKYSLPLIIISSSGGARMQEGALSLMQMAKTCSALTKFFEKKLFYISVLTDPTMGGVSASFAFLGDIVIAEPNALIGFAGPRVIKETIKEKLPKGFQKSEFLLEHGFLDFIVHRAQLKLKLAKLIDFFHNY